MKQHRLVHFSRQSHLWVTLALLAPLAGMDWFQQRAVKLRANPAVVPPTVHIIIPEKGTLVTETTTIQASASDDQSVAKVEFYIGDELESTQANRFD